MKCSKCGYDNLPEGTQDGKCDECGHPLLPEGENSSSQISDSVNNSVVSTSTIKRVVNYIGDSNDCSIYYGSSAYDFL